MKTTIFCLLLILQSAASPGSITVVSPNGGETIVAQGLHQIEWTSVDVVSDVRIDYSIDNGTNWTPVVDADIPNSGSFLWDPVPGELTENGLVRIRTVSDPLIEDISDNPFFIYQCQLVFNSDSNRDCYINLEDYRILAGEWLLCGNPFDSFCNVGCPPYRADCDGPFNGCECFFSHAEAGCLDTACVMGNCLPNYYDINSDPNDGCEYFCQWSGGTDVPDDDFIDANCDGIDGQVNKAVFVAKTGSNANTGTSPELPKLTIQAGINAAVANGREYVLISQGTYSETVMLASGVSLYGGYNAAVGWARNAAYTTTISSGSSQALNGSSVTKVTIAHLTIRSGNVGSPGQSSYSVFLASASNISIHRCEIVSGNGAAGISGTPGSAGQSGYNGSLGQSGCENGTWPCNTCGEPQPGNGGSSPAGNTGGKGGYPGLGSDPAQNGSPGINGGGAGGLAGATGSNGGTGGIGPNGTTGVNGSGGNNFGAVSASVYTVASGSTGTNGQPGRGGGGGGGGGGGILICDSYGGGGGGGGGGGTGGNAGTGGAGGGGSFGIWLYQCASVFVDECAIQTGNGGNGGAGGAGGAGGNGGSGRSGGSGQDDSGAGGTGGNGGQGGQGGYGGGGGGGPAIGIVSIGTSLSQNSNNFILGNGGLGGNAPNPGMTGLRTGVYTP